MEPKQLILDYLKDVYIMQLATVDGDQPAVCNVHFYADDDLNLYWLSNTETHHSKNLAVNPRAAVTMAVHTDMPLIGVQLQGDASECDPSECEPALRAYAKRHDREEWVQNIIDGKGDIKPYKFTPHTLGVFDFKNFPKDPKQEWPL
jgi:uncharacterized protein YhbP (UPF0306 family)